MKFFTKLLVLFIAFFTLTSASSDKINIREGSSSYGKNLYNYDGKHVGEGSSSYGKFSSWVIVSVENLRANLLIFEEIRNFI